MARKKNKDGYVLKSKIQSIIQSYIRNIQMNDYGNDNGIPQLYGVMEQVESQPNADVVEVKHGEWIWTENGEADYEQFWVCSVCKEKSYIETKFCSECGAKMDGGKVE